MIATPTRTAHMVATSSPRASAVSSTYTVVTIGCDDFEGSYEYTPSRETQVIQIEGKKATQDITIKPIPNNYGLITWDGATLTVS